MVQDINSEVTGSVWKVLCAPGQDVSEGDSLFILESMKMEIPVLAEDDGVLTELMVQEGQAVVDGQTLARIEVG